MRIVRFQAGGEPRYGVVEDDIVRELVGNVFGRFRVTRKKHPLMPLFPGDIIATGTPSGIGPMKPGDTIEIEIEGIGRLRNTVTRQS